MKKVYVKYCKYFLFGLLVMVIGSLAGCGQNKTASESESALSSEPSPASEPASASNITNAGTFPLNSLLYFNDDKGSAELIQYFEDGNVPEEVNALYDQEGGNPEITITDAETIKEVYKYLGMIKVDGETDMGATDSYHYVQFKLADDRYIYYSFEGTDIWRYGGKNYSISNSGKLFGLIKELTDENAFPEESQTEETPAAQQEKGQDAAQSQEPAQSQAPDQSQEPTQSQASDDNTDLYKETTSGNIQIEYPTDWEAQTSGDKIVMSKDGTENYPFFSVEEIGWVGSPGTFVTNQMNTFTEKYQNRVAMHPEVSGMEVAGMKLAGFTAKYSSYDGSATITRLEYVEVIDDITYHFVCEYVSDVYGDQHEDETTYFEFMHAIESMKIKAE